MWRTRENRRKRAWSGNQESNVDSTSNSSKMHILWALIFVLSYDYNSSAIIKATKELEKSNERLHIVYQEKEVRMGI